MTRYASAAALTFILVSAVAATATAQGKPTSHISVFRRLDGSSVQGAIVSIDRDWVIGAVTLTNPEKLAGAGEPSGKAFQVKLSELAFWGRQEETSNPFVVLVDGSHVAGDLIRFGRTGLTVGIDYEVFSQRSIWEPTTIPLSEVRGVVLQPPGDLGERDKLRTWMKLPKVRTDRLRLTNGDELAGVALRVALRSAQENPKLSKDDKRPVDSLPPARDPLEVEAENQRVFWFKTGGRETSAPLEHVRAVAMNPAIGKPSGKTDPGVMLAFRDGSRLLAKAIELSGRDVTVRTVCGTELKTTHDRFIKQLVMIQSLQSDRVDYLSDLDSLSYRHIPFLSTSWPNFGSDQNVRGGCLRADNVCYEKGIAMHSASRLAYDLAKPYGLFQAELAIDDSVGDIGSVVFRVYLDKGNGKFAPAYASPIIRGGRSPVPVSIDVDGAKRLALIVDFSDRGDAGDHANWLNARLVRVP